MISNRSLLFLIVQRGNSLIRFTHAKDAQRKWPAPKKKWLGCSVISRESWRYWTPRCTSFSRCSSLDIRLFTYVFSCSLWRSFHRILHILVSSLTFLGVFLDLLYVITSCFFWSLSLFLFILFSRKTLSPQTWIITISSRWQSFSSAGIVALRVDQKM